MRTITRFFLTLVVCAAAVFGQADANKGQITGTVFDPNQAVVPGVQIRLRNMGTGFTRDVVSNEAGQYRAVLLDPGAYEITAQTQGFEKATVTGLTLNVGSTVNIDIKLQLQATTTTVDVGETLVNITMPSPSAVLNNAAITNLPINGRRYQDFATLTPSVQVEPSRSQLSFAGQRGINTNVMLDGADNNQPFFGGVRGGERSNTVLTVPQSAVQEFQVVTTGYSAEYGRSTGGVLNTITKSGSNDTHGETFYQLRHRSLSAKNPIFNVKPSETLQQFGGGVGGPIRKDKLFYFVSAESQKANTPRQVFFAQLVGRAATPDTRDAFDYFKRLEEPFKQTNRSTALLGRGDYQFAGGHRLTARYNHSNSREVNAASVGGALNPFTNNALNNEGIEADRYHIGTVQYTHLVSSSVVNDLKFTESYEIRPRLANSSTPLVEASVIGSYGTRSFLPTTQEDMRFQITDGLSITRGTHLIKVGFDFNRTWTGQEFGFNQFGRFTILGADVNTILDLLTVGGQIRNRFDSPNVRYQRQIGNLKAAFAMRQAAVYAQDSWRVSRGLTIDLGLRWEGQWNPQPEADNTALISRFQGVRFPIGVTFDPTRVPNVPKQIAPRFGFAWTPFQGGRRTVVRGHTGLFYASTPMLLFAGPNNNYRNPPGDLSLAIFPTPTQSLHDLFLRGAGINLNDFALDKLPVLTIEQTQRIAALQSGGAPDPFRGASVFGMANDFTNPRSFQTGLGVETEAARNLIVGVQLNYVNTVRLQRNRDYNLPGPILRPTDRSQRPFYGGIPRPVPSAAVMNVRESTARSLYRGMTFQSQYRARRAQFGAFYTISDTFSDDDNERDTTGGQYDNTFNLRPDYNYSNLHVRHQFVANAVGQLPWGFELAGLARAYSGRPINATTGADTNADGSIAIDRPYSAPGQVFKRNAFLNRPIRTVDFRVMKSFKLWNETSKIQFSAEFFNLFNIDNVVFGDPSNARSAAFVYGLGTDPATGNNLPIDPRFMRLRAADGNYDRNNTQLGSPRQIQLGLRFFF